MAITLRIDPVSLARVNLLLGGIKNGAGTALSRAVNKGLAGASPETKSVVTEKTLIKSSVVGEQVNVADRATPQHVNGRVVIGEGAYGKGKGVALLDFYNVRETAKGVTYAVSKGKARLLLPGAFKTRMKSGHVGIFQRAGYTNLDFARGTKGVLRGTRKDASQRKEAISEVFRTSVVDASADRLDAIATRMQGRLDLELERQVDLLLSKL